MGELQSTSLFVLESGARFPSYASDYRGSDTAIVHQQPGEPEANLARRVRQSAQKLQLTGVPLGTVILIVGERHGSRHSDRRRVALTLVEQLPRDGQLVLVADGAKPPLQRALMALVGTLIEQDHLRHSIALDFDIHPITELRTARAPLLSREALPRKAVSIASSNPPATRPRHHQKQAAAGAAAR